MQQPHFRIYPTPTGWSWETVGSDGETLANGVSACKRQAAALVIRALVREVIAEGETFARRPIAA
jgi:hypothetical protein